MPFTPPQPGLVINYAFLWPHEAETGQEEGVKDRPCAVVLATALESDSTSITVLIVPITHTRPEDAASALEIPAATKKRLGLDDQESWIITDRLNRFIWPGPDIRPLPSGDVAYGFLPKKLAEEAIRQVRSHASEKTAQSVIRD